MGNDQLSPSCRSAIGTESAANTNAAIIHAATSPSLISCHPHTATNTQFMTEALPNAAECVTLLWDKFDTNRTKIVNALEVIAGLAIMCVGPILEVRRFPTPK